MDGRSGEKEAFLIIVFHKRNTHRAPPTIHHAPSLSFVFFFTTYPCLRARAAPARTSAANGAKVEVQDKNAST